jgi:phosphopantothenoylcysteine synthetase/decarboxylase
MKLLVTAGNTQAPIDRVRCLTNIFTGRTGAAIAACASSRGHQVTLLTSQPDTVAQAPSARLQMISYHTFAELDRLLEEHVPAGANDAVIHAAAVSDYLVAGVFAPAEGTGFASRDLTTALGTWRAEVGAPTLVERRAGKIKSDDPELWLRLTRAPKLIDRMRSDWKFRGTLVKFKLEVDVSDEQLLHVAEASRRQSQADWMVANTLEGAAAWAYLGPFKDGYHKVSRAELPARLLDTIESSVAASFSPVS